MKLSLEERGKELEGVLFTGHTENRFSEKNGKAYASCGGTAKINGEIYLITGFLREDRAGYPYYNLVFKLKREVDALFEQ